MIIDELIAVLIKGVKKEECGVVVLVNVNF